nr:cation transporter [Aromatoleum petrolei]
MRHHHALGELPAQFGRAFSIGIALNVGFVLVEAFYGWRTGSLALLADAAHNLSDVGGLALAWLALAAGRRDRTHATPTAGGALPSWRALPTRSSCW